MPTFAVFAATAVFLETKASVYPVFAVFVVIAVD